MGCKGVFVFSILWCSWSGDHPYDDLARFGYILDMKVEKKLETFKFLFLATYWNFSWKSGDLDSIFVGTWRIWVLYFSTWKILSVGRNHNFQVKIWRNFAKQKHWVCSFPNHSSKQVTYRGHRERQSDRQREEQSWWLLMCTVVCEPWRLRDSFQLGEMNTRDRGFKLRQRPP